MTTARYAAPPCETAPSRHMLTPEDADIFTVALDAPLTPTPRAMEAAPGTTASSWFMPTER